MTDTTDGVAVPIAGVLQVPCGQTVAVTVGGKVFLVSATDSAPTAEIPATDESLEDVLKRLQEAQKKGLEPYTRFGPGGITTLRNDDMPGLRLPQLIDLESASTLVGHVSLTDNVAVTVLRSHGVSLHLPADDLDEAQLTALFSEDP